MLYGVDQDAALAELDAAAMRLAEIEDARKQLRAAVRAAAEAGVKQVEIVRRSGWTREYIRRLTDAKTDQQ